MTGADRREQDQLLTTKEVAERMGVGPTSVKRWADAGILPCVKTAGGHRRFLSSQVTRFIEAQGAMNAEARGEPLPIGEWIELLRRGDSLHEVQARLLGERRRLGAWWRVADSMGRVLTEIGERWAQGSLRIIDEHLASEQLHRAFAQCAEAIPVPPGARRCLLATVEREEHVLGLSLAEPVLREAGWLTSWAGTRTPAGELAAWARTRTSELIAVSASRASRDPEQMRAFVDEVGAACAVSGVRLVLGGEAAWPDGHPLAVRVRSFEGLHRVLMS